MRLYLRRTISRLAGLVLPGVSKFVVDDVMGKGRTDLLPKFAWIVGAAALVQAATSFGLSQILGVAAQKAIIDIENYLVGTSQLSQTTLRSVLGQSELDELLSQREKINIRLQHIIDQQTEPWGVKVTHVEVKQIDLPQEMQRAMAKQAEAERERRAKVIAAEGEFQASQRLSDAAKILEQQPSALTLRYLQTLREIATENNSTTIFPIPLDFFKPFIKNIDDSVNKSGQNIPGPVITENK